MTNPDKNLELATSIIEMTKGDTTGWYAELYERQDESVQVLLDKIMHKQYKKEHGRKSRKSRKGRKGRVHLTVSAEPLDGFASPDCQTFDQAPPDCENVPETSDEEWIAGFREEPMDRLLNELREEAKVNEAKPQSEPEPLQRVVKISIKVGSATADFEIPMV